MAGQQMDPRVNGSIVHSLVSYLRRALGPDVLAEMLDEVGLQIESDDATTTWYAARDLTRLVEVAERRTGDPELGRRAGEEILRTVTELISFLHAAGSISRALRVAVNLGSRSRTDPAFRIVDRGASHMVVHATAAKSTRFACGVSAGYWTQIPSLFGSVGTVVEPLCVTRGDPHCEFRVTWEPEAEGSPEGVERSRRRGDSMVARFEELQVLAAELAAESTTAGLLEKIAERSVSAVMAPHAVVAVRMSDRDALQVGWSGLDEPRALEIGHSLDMGAYVDDPSVGVSQLSSPRRNYGYLAVLAQAGSSISDQERRMLHAYASHATAAIEAAAALDEARVQRDTAESLLGLARALAGVGGFEDISQRVAEAIPTVVACDLSAVMLWDPESGHLRFAGSWPHSVDELGFDTIKLADAPAARTLVEDQKPTFVHAAETDGMLRSLLRAAGAGSVGAAPIVIRGEVFGVVLAASSDDHAAIDVDITLHRLSGLADHAATALDNSSLLERIRHQALHDPLTGLPNRTLVEDRVEHALTLAERADRWITLLFVDLDRFKEVNDQLGHAAGDALLRELAVRLQGCVRSSDTVSRLGGDEFLVLLENTCGDEDGVKVAEKIIESLGAPFTVDGGSVSVSVSIGITSAAGRGSDYDELVTRADQAMYEVKREGRDGWSVFRPQASDAVVE